MDKDLFYRGDLQYINSRFRKFCENEENFFDVLDDMLDIATVLPVCEYEYASKLDLFRQFEHVYDALLELKEMLFSYGIQLRFSPLLESKIKG